MEQRLENGREKGQARGQRQGLLKGLEVFLRLPCGTAGLDLLPHFSHGEEAARQEPWLQTVEQLASIEELRGHLATVANTTPPG